MRQTRTCTEKFYSFMKVLRPSWASCDSFDSNSPSGDPLDGVGGLHEIHVMNPVKQNYNGKSRLEFFQLFFCEMAIKVSHICGNFTQRLELFTSILRTSSRMRPPTSKNYFYFTRRPSEFGNYPVSDGRQALHILGTRWGNAHLFKFALFMTRLPHIALSRKLLETFRLLPLHT